MNFKKWLLASFEGADGKLSSKKASTFAFTFMVAGMITFTAYIRYWHPEASQVFPDIAWITVTAGAIGMSATQAIQSIKQKK